MNTSDEVAIRRLKKLWRMFFDAAVDAFAIFGVMTMAFILYVRIKAGI